jgi:outer membrane immunogenic protein
VCRAWPGLDSGPLRGAFVLNWRPVKFRAGIAAAALMAMPLTARAADLPPMLVFSWGGFYLGINGGYAWGSTDWAGGGWLIDGYNEQTGKWVRDIEGDIDWVDLNGTANVCANCTIHHTYR